MKIADRFSCYGKPGIPIILLVAAVIVTFGNTLFNGFVWDDCLYTVHNAVYARFDLFRIFFTPANGIEYLPVTDLSFALDYLFWNNNAAGFHAANVCYYAFTVFAIYCLATATALHLSGSENGDSRARTTGLAAALLFAVHPLHSEVVSFISCRNVILATLFFLLSCRLFLRFLEAPGRKGRWLHYCGALLLFCASLLSKATGIILPLVLALYVMMGHQGRRGLLLVLLGPFFLLSLGAFLLFRNVASQAHVILATPRWDLAYLTAQMREAGQIVVFYLGKLLVPVPLSADYDLFSSRMPNPVLTFLALAALLAVTGLGIRQRTKRPYILFSVAWYVSSLLPVLNFFPTHPVVADRYAFLPSFAFCFLMASAASEIWTRIGRPAIVATALVAALWSCMAFLRNRVWQSDETLWKDTIATSPGVCEAYTNLGRVYFASNPADPRAGQLFEQARRINPGDATCDYFLGYRCYLQNDIAGAVEHLKDALGRDLEFIEALYLLGVIYQDKGEKEKAAQYFELAIKSREPDQARLKPEAERRLAAMYGSP